MEEALDLSSDRILNDDLKNRRGYSHLKEEALDRTVWRNNFGGNFEPVVRQNTERIMVPTGKRVSYLRQTTSCALTL